VGRRHARRQRLCCTLNGSWACSTGPTRWRRAPAPALPSHPPPHSRRPRDVRTTTRWRGRAATATCWIWGPPFNPIDTGVVMAPGTSPSITRHVDGRVCRRATTSSVTRAPRPPVDVCQRATGVRSERLRPGDGRGHQPQCRHRKPSATMRTLPIAFQGGNGHLWMYNDAGDTGLAMNGRNQPQPHGHPRRRAGRAARRARRLRRVLLQQPAPSRCSSTTTSPTAAKIELPTALVAAAGTSPAIVSALNEAGRRNGSPATQYAPPPRPPATASATAPAGPPWCRLKLPSKPTVTPLQVQPVVIRHLPHGARAPQASTPHAG